ncbi:MAG: flagellar hook-associated protein FlgK, partial [Myxococcota bacterium]
MSLFGILNIGKQGLLAHQKAINTTANNIANVNTPGYTRQRAVFVPTAPAIAPDGTPLGGGVRMERVERIVDAALDSQLLRERQRLGFDQRMETGLDRLEGIFDELSDTGISSSLRDFFNSIQDLSSDAGDTQREMVVQTGLTLTEQIRDVDRRMDQLQTDANLSIEQVVGEINELVQQVASFNGSIFNAEGAGQPASALRDARSAVLTELAEKIDFTTFERDDGNVAVFVAGGFLLVDQTAAGQLDLRPRGSGPDPEFFEIDQNFGGANAGPLTSLISGGDLGGL